MTENEINSAIQKIDQARTERLRAIQNSIAEELAKISQKYQTADKVGAGATIIAIIFIAVFYLTIVLFDLLKLLPYIKSHKKPVFPRTTRIKPYPRAEEALIDFEKSRQLQSQMDQSYFRLACAVYARRDQAIV